MNENCMNPKSTTDTCNHEGEAARPGILTLRKQDYISDINPRTDNNSNSDTLVDVTQVSDKLSVRTVDMNENCMNPKLTTDTCNYDGEDVRPGKLSLTKQDYISGMLEIALPQINSMNPKLGDTTIKHADVQPHETRLINHNYTSAISKINTNQTSDINHKLGDSTAKHEDVDVQPHETRLTNLNYTSAIPEIIINQTNDINHKLGYTTSEHEGVALQLVETSAKSKIIGIQTNDLNLKLGDATYERDGEEVDPNDTGLRQQHYASGTSELLSAEIDHVQPELLTNTFEYRGQDSDLHELRFTQQSCVPILSEFLPVAINYINTDLVKNSSENGIANIEIDLSINHSELEQSNDSIINGSDISPNINLINGSMLQNDKASIPFTNSNAVLEAESDIDDGSDYNPENDSSEQDSSDNTDIEGAEPEDAICTPNRRANLSNSKNKSSDGSFNLSSTSNVQGTFACDDSNMTVQPSSGPQGVGKLYFCFYCHKKTTKIARHLERVHKDEEDVKKFVVLPKKSAERAELIKNLRNKGNFIHNKHADLNHGDLIVCRRPQRKLNKNAEDFVPCPRCRGFFAKSNVRHHFKHCTDGRGSNSRSILVSSRKILGRINPDASTKLRRRIIPVMREDNIVRLIRYDRLIILYGNKMCRKYKSQHQDDMIRAHLRLLGRFLTDIKSINPNISDFASIYDPKFYDAVISSVNNLAGLDEETETYRCPSVASSIGTCIKKIGAILETECIKQHDNEKKNNATDFLKLLNEDFGCSVSKTVVESQVKRQRLKKIELPMTDDITKLNAFLNKQRESALQSLNHKFTFEAWLSLAQATLILVQVFNRRRAGEIERVTIDDFNSYKNADEMDEDLFTSLSNENQEAARRYVRFTIRGKLNRTVPVLLSTEILESIKTILKFRNAAGVPEKNPYLFGLPSGNDNKRHMHLRACNLMRKFAQECAAKKANTLRGTTLRKHVATKCAAMDLPANEISDIANFMGHHEYIHKNIYRQPVASRDIIRMSQVLEHAVGTICAGKNSENRNNENVMKDTDSVTIHPKETDDNVDNVNFNQSIVRQDPLPARTNTKNQTYREQKDKDHKRYTKRNASTELLGDVEDQSCYDLNGNFSYTNSSCSDIEADGQLRGRGVIKRKHSFNQEQTKRRSTSPFGKTKRRRWSQDEVDAALDMFAEDIKQSIIPSLRIIEKKIAKHAILKSRNSVVVKAWINNTIKKNERMEFRRTNDKHTENGLPSRKNKGNSSKNSIKSVFINQIKKKCIPTLQECVKAGKISEALSKLSAKEMQALVFQEIQANE